MCIGPERGISVRDRDFGVRGPRGGRGARALRAGVRRQHGRARAAPTRRRGQRRPRPAPAHGRLRLSGVSGV